MDSGGAGGQGGAGGGSLVAPSCIGLLDDCGPNTDEDCCASPVVEGGTFKRSYDNIEYTDAANEATVSSFRLDRFEVTVGRMRKFIDQYTGHPGVGDGAHPLVPNSGWKTEYNGQMRMPGDKATIVKMLKVHPDCLYTDEAASNENRPINCTNWYLAFAFCAWDQGRLPTEAEWNYAAAGGNEQRQYPWGMGIDSAKANYEDSDNAVGLPVGNYSPDGDGRWGQSDLAGNLSEMVLDYSGDYPVPCENCANLNPSGQHMSRGGYWSQAGDKLVSARRQPVTLGAKSRNWGLRCARSP